jgi:ABC-type transport system involved in Fe-S cluster assembly fused permease/ATPase subunit
MIYGEQIRFLGQGGKSFIMVVMDMRNLKNSFKNSTFLQPIYSMIWYIQNLYAGNAQNNVIVCAVVTVVGKILTNLQPLLIGLIVDTKKFSNLLFLIIMFCIISFLSGVCISAKNYYMTIVKEECSKHLSFKLTEKLQKLSHSFFFEKNSAEIRKIHDIGANTIYTILVCFISEILPLVITFPIILLVILYKLSPIYSVTIFITSIIYAYIGFKYISKEKLSITNLNTQDISIDSNFYENIINFETIKITSSEKFRLKIFNSIISKFIYLSRVHAKIFFVKSVYQNFTMLIGTVTIFSIAVYDIHQGIITVGDLIILNSYFLLLIAPLADLARYYTAFNQAVANIAPLRSILLRKDDLKTMKPLGVITYPVAITIENLSFSYKDNINVINNISMNIPAKSKIAIVGSNGSGKSTIAKLLMRFYDPLNGRIIFNNVDILST